METMGINIFVKQNMLISLLIKLISFLAIFTLHFKQKTEKSEFGDIVL